MLLHGLVSRYRATLPLMRIPLHRRAWFATASHLVMSRVLFGLTLGCCALLPTHILFPNGSFFLHASPSRSLSCCCVVFSSLSRLAYRRPFAPFHRSPSDWCPQVLLLRYDDSFSHSSRPSFFTTFGAKEPLNGCLRLPFPSAFRAPLCLLQPLCAARH
ncbi:hypothetical protein EJ06DRAFT_359681 [Trichodelitschia bisporula]|uniref:Transmembrane protein n=1 Tax=Trichodelitschia bisporula TaxID=703511 RepID=A0A6G1I0J0_9PEZI|nr:hypothetical protein EJ06DRAFT_359681 [Trichodelitschia bisporula]